MVLYVITRTIKLAIKFKEDNSNTVHIYVYFLSFLLSDEKARLKGFPTLAFKKNALSCIHQNPRKESFKRVIEL